MTFQAIVHAPSLRRGARLNIADLGQSTSQRPKRLGVGDEVELRFGVCCPDLARGIVVNYDTLPESAVLEVEGTKVTICHRVGEQAVGQPGLRSESWFVA